MSSKFGLHVKDSVSAVCRISLDYTCETYTGHLSETQILGGSSYDDLRQSAAVLVSAVYHTIEIVKTV